MTCRGCGKGNNRRPCLSICQVGNWIKSLIQAQGGRHTTLLSYRMWKLYGAIQWMPQCVGGASDLCLAVAENAK